MSEKINAIRGNTLNLIERNERNYKLAFVGRGSRRVAFYRRFLVLADFSNRVHLLLFVSSFSVYTILIFGLAALGLHVNRNTLRVLNAIELIEKNAD